MYHQGDPKAKESQNVEKTSRWIGWGPVQPLGSQCLAQSKRKRISANIAFGIDTLRFTQGGITGLSAPLRAHSMVPLICAGQLAHLLPFLI